MKKLLLSLLVACLTTQTVLQAEAKPAGAVSDVSIVVVDLQRVLGSLDEIRMEMEKLKEETMLVAQELNDRDQELRKKSQEFETKKNAMDAKAQEKIKKELDQEKMAFMQDAQQVDMQYQEGMQRLQVKYLEKIKSFCRKQGWQIVVPAALYVAPQFDMTDEVISGLNKEYKRAQEAKKKAKESEKAK